jgi:hypothetical protein
LARGLAALHVGAIALLVGASASAEERQMGTIASDALLPMARWRRWAVKVATAAGVVVVLGIMLPWVMNLLFPGPFPRGIRQAAVGRFSLMNLLRMNVEGVAAIGTAFAVSLYVSSLATGALRAFLAAIGALVVTGTSVLAPFYALMMWVRFNLFGWLELDGQSALVIWLVDQQAGLVTATYRWLPNAFAAVLVLMVIRYAGANHASLERPLTLIRRQVPRLVAFVLVAALLQGTVFAVLNEAWSARWRQRQWERRHAPVGATAPAPAQPSSNSNLQSPVSGAR